MKNIHVLSTDKPSRLFKSELINSFGFQSENKIVPNNRLINQNIYITSDEEIKEGDWVVENHTFKREPYVGKCFYPKNDGTVTDEILKRDLLSVKYEGHYETLAQKHNCKKIILTTDPDLIKDGVQAIDDKFLEWFVKNPSCELVEVNLQHQYHSSKEFYHDADFVNCDKVQYESIKSEIPTCLLRILYKIIIPQEEPNPCKNIHVLTTDKPSKLQLSETNTYYLIDEKGYYGTSKPQYIYITSDEEIKEGDWYFSEFHKTPLKCCHINHARGLNLLKNLPENRGKIILTTDPDLIKDGVQAIDDEFLQWFINNPTQENIDILKCPIEGLYTIDLRKEKHKQYPIGGYAPGNYYCTCASCKTMFQGDKRAVQCEPCAIEMKHKQENCEYIHEVGCIKDICTCNTGPKQETLEEAAERILFENTKNTEIKYRGGRNMVIKSMLDIAKWQAERMYSEEDMISFVTWLSDLSFDLQHFNKKGLKPFNELFPIWFKQYKKK